MIARPTFPIRSLVTLGAVFLVGLSLEARAALISHWEFDGNFNATVGTNGTAVNGAGFGADRFGNPNSSLSVNGASEQYVSVAGGGGLDGLQAGTIAFFAQWNGIQDSACCSSHANVAGRQSNGIFSNHVIGLSGIDPASSGVTWQPYGAGPPAITGGTPVGDGEWHHIAIVFASGNHTLYIDGNVDGTSSNGGGMSANNAIPLAIGAWNGDGAGYSTSQIDDFRVYNNLLTQGEVQALIPEPSTGLFAALGVFGFTLRRRR